MDEVERLVSAARPEWPEPPAVMEERILASLGLAPPRTAPAGWLRRAPRSRRLRLLVVGAALAASGTALGVALIDRSGGSGSGAAASLAFEAPVAPLRSAALLDGEDVAVGGGGEVVVVAARAGRVVAVARAGGTWEAPVRLGHPRVRARNPAVAAGPGGRAVAVWRERVPGREVSQRFTLPGGAPAGSLTVRLGTRWRAVASVRSPAGWSPAEPVSPPARRERDIRTPDVAMTDSGEAIAAYALDGRVWAVGRGATGAWGRPAPLSRGPGVAADPALAIDAASGWAVAVWASRIEDARVGRRWSVRAAVQPPGRPWEPAHALAAGLPGVPFPAAAINGRGEAAVVWQADGTRAATRSAAGSWSAAELIAEASPAPLPVSVAVGPRGEAYALTSASAGPPGTSRTVSHLLRRPPGGAWAPASPGLAAAARALAMDRAGGVVLLRAPAGGPVDVVAPGRGRARLAGLGTPIGLAVGRDGTVAAAGVRSTRQPGSILSVAVAPGTGRP